MKGPLQSQGLVCLFWATVEIWRYNMAYWLRYNCVMIKVLLVTFTIKRHV